LGVRKIDLGEEWSSMTGLPFIWAFWAGRPGVLPPEAVAALTAARDAGVAASDEVAMAYCGPARAAMGQAYLRENIQYVMTDPEMAGLRTYYDLAAHHRLIDAPRQLLFYPSTLREPQGLPGQGRGTTSPGQAG
jgi:predicted solute-binding protein